MLTCIVSTIDKVFVYSILSLPIIYLLIIALIFIPIKPIITSYDVINYNCVDIAYDTYRHFDKLGMSVKFFYTSEPAHVWVKVETVFGWIDYFGVGEGEEVSLDRILEWKYNGRR